MKDGESAFPSGVDDQVEPSRFGMSLRDYFAGHALVGLLAYSGQGGPQMNAKVAASAAYDYADAMIEAMEEE